MSNRPRHRFVFLINSAQRRLQQWMAQQQAEAAAHGELAPTPAQAGVLFLLKKTDGATMGQLAEALDLGAPATSGLIQRLEALGWVQRQPDPEDGRTQRVWLQAAGLAQLPGLQRVLQRINARLTDGFTEAELDVVARWLQHVQQIDTRAHDQE
jgi:DNA-binding MarR family transcriptional regulator